MEREKDIGTKVYDFLGRFIRYPNDHCRVIHTLWIIHTHLIDAFFTTPRLFILSAERRCGKSTLNRINKLLSQNANSWVNPSPASVYRFVDLQKAQRPTLQIDELDRMYQRGETADMTTLIDSGFQRGDTIPRAEKDKKGQWSIKTYECFSPLLLLGIDNGYYPDTVLDRSIPIRLKRMLANETVEPYRFRKIGPQAAALKEEVAAWAKTVLEKAGDLEPTMPEEIRQRDADKWEPLFIVARLLDRQNVTADTDGTAVTDIPGWWETKAREAALATLKEDREAEPASYRELLLRDIKTVFEKHKFNYGKDIIQTQDLLDMLWGIKESPWLTYSRNGLDARGLAKLLRPHGIRPTTIRFDKNTEAKGYYKADFKDAWTRYLFPGTSVTTETPVTSVTNREATPYSEDGRVVSRGQLKCFPSSRDMAIASTSVYPSTAVPNF